VLVEVENPVPGAAAVAAALDGGRDASYAELLRARGQLVPGGETIPMGVPPESALFARGADEMLGLLGGRCVDCGTISTPPTIHPTCISCGGPKLEPVALARGGAVHTYVINQTMPAPFVAPLPIAVLDMDDGARLMLQVVGDGTDVQIGGRVHLVLRKYAHERGVPVYGFKARPARGGSESA
jgi:hydroxymethylglutaryl-CoA synthase